MPSRSTLRLLLSCFVMLTAPLTVSAQTGIVACTCQNLESIQQDYQNAVYLESFFRKLSGELKGYETRDLAKGVSRADIDAFGFQFLADAKQVAMKLPFPAIKGYEGPEVIEMPWGTCEQDWVLLDLMKDRSPCKAMADAALQHETEHREKCAQMGAEAYWARFASEMAAEEADRYTRQAAALKAEIARVLDVSTVQLRGEWMHTFTNSDATIDYFYTFDSGDLKGVMDQSELIKLTGTGSTSNQLLGLKAEGVTCTSTGAVTNSMEVTMTTDGLNFGVELTETNTGGDLMVDCGFGGAMAVPTGEASSGMLSEGVPLKVGDNMMPNRWADQIIALAESEGMSVIGEPTTSLSITCEKP